MNNRISAQSKDNIRHYYSRKTSEIKSEVMKKLNLLVEKEIKELYENEKYKNFSKQFLEFFDYLDELDPDDEFNWRYCMKQVRNKINEENFFSKPYSSSIEKIYYDNPDLIEANQEISRLNKECNKIIWNLEMASKKSEEYKEAFNKAQEILFKE